MIMRRVSSVVFSLLLLLAANGASAGDFATREILGFSADGTRFAFEEYGVQDGSGFPYSNIYLVDTTNDSWVAGSPYRARIDEESADISAARETAREMAGDTLDGITEPGILNATNQPLEVVDDPMRMVARPFQFTPPTTARIEFRIEPFPLVAQPLCDDFGGAKGFRLLQVFNEPGKATQLLHEDNAIPESRGCPLTYRFADIVTYTPKDNTKAVTAILVLYETVGFEGPDGRYLAVTTTHTGN